jgi:hypothetical protein
MPPAPFVKLAQDVWIVQDSIADGNHEPIGSVSGWIEELERICNTVLPATDQISQGNTSPLPCPASDQKLVLAGGELEGLSDLRCGRRFLVRAGFLDVIKTQIEMGSGMPQRSRWTACSNPARQGHATVAAPAAAGNLPRGSQRCEFPCPTVSARINCRRGACSIRPNFVCPDAKHTKMGMIDLISVRQPIRVIRVIRG